MSTMIICHSSILVNALNSVQYPDEFKLQVKVLKNSSSKHSCTFKVSQFNVMSSSVQVKRKDKRNGKINLTSYTHLEKKK